MKALYALVGMAYSPLGLKTTNSLLEGMPLILLREPTNSHDPNAVAVYVRVGYIRAKQATSLAPKMDAAATSILSAKVSRNEGNYIELEVEEPHSHTSPENESVTGWAEEALKEDPNNV